MIGADYSGPLAPLGTYSSMYSLGEAGDLVHEPVGERPALGAGWSSRWSGERLGAGSRLHLHRRPEADDDQS